MALNHRDRTGQGQKVDLSLMKTGALATSDDFLRYEGKKDRPLADAGVHGLSALYRLYETGDGWVFSRVLAGEGMGEVEGCPE